MLEAVDLIRGGRSAVESITRFSGLIYPQKWEDQLRVKNASVNPPTPSRNHSIHAGVATPGWGFHVFLQVRLVNLHFLPARTRAFAFVLQNKSFLGCCVRPACKHTHARTNTPVREVTHGSDMSVPARPWGRNRCREIVGVLKVAKTRLAFFQIHIGKQLWLSLFDHLFFTE